jgi:omega-6 fatty acid desaturase (delta-12 desaturase)
MVRATGIGGILNSFKTGLSHQELREIARQLTLHCRDYCKADTARAVWQLATSLAPFFALLTAIILLQPVAAWLSLLLAIPAGLLLVRIFAIQHDCGHGSFFEGRRANNVWGHALSVLTFTPYIQWRDSHAVHHTTSGHLDHRGIGDIETKTVREYQAMTAMQRLRYRIYRNPLVMLVIGPSVHFLIFQRVAFLFSQKGKSHFVSVVLHDAALLACYGALCWLLGPWLAITSILPVVLVAACVGGALFYLQHQFEDTTWDGGDEWDQKIAALTGSSHMILPPVLNWFTCDIALHHIHHLCSRIPNYRLRECMAANETLGNIATKVTLRDNVKYVQLALWDEANRKLISFREFARAHQTPSFSPNL